jgi:hypothetical protein
LVTGVLQGNVLQATDVVVFSDDEGGGTETFAEACTYRFAEGVTGLTCVESELSGHDPPQEFDDVRLSFVALNIPTPYVPLNCQQFRFADRQLLI